MPVDLTIIDDAPSNRENDAIRIASINRLNDQLRGLSESVRTGLFHIVAEAGVFMDPPVLHSIIHSPECDVLAAARPLESRFSSTESVPLQTANNRLQLLMGIYRLSDGAYRKMRDLLGNDTMSNISEYLSREDHEMVSIGAANSEVESRSPAGPPVREQIPRMIDIGEHFVTKRATNGREKLRSEVQWLRCVPESARSLFSEVLEAQLDGDVVSYTMPRYPMHNLEEMVFAGEISLAEANQLLVRVFSSLSERLYVSRTVQPYPGYIRRKYLEKIPYRTETASTFSPLFAKYATAPSLLVNGKKLPGLSAFLRAMSEDISFLADMEPQSFCPVHADLKPDNILTIPNHSDLRLIDPMGVELDDTALDGAKPLSTFLAYHHAFKNSGMQIELDEGETLGVRSTFIGDGILDRDIAKVCEQATEQVSRLPFFASDSQWLARTKLHSALIQLGFASFHLLATDGKEDRVAVGLLARGLEMLNDVYPLAKCAQQRGRFCNYKFPSDRKLIEKMLQEPA